MQKVLAITLLVCLSTAAAHGASFDCHKAYTRAEKTICSNPDLSRADERLAKSFKEALAASTDKQALRREQKEWPSSQRDVCPTAACILGAYLARIGQLERVSSGAAAASNPASEMASVGAVAGPLRVENRHIDRKPPGCTGKENTGCAYVEFSYPEVAGGPAAACARINAAIMAFVTADWVGPEDVIQPRDKYKVTPGSFLEDIVDSAGRFQRENPCAFSSELVRRVTVLRNAAPLFSLECFEYSYTGGTHGLSGKQYLNFDLATGEPVKLASILKEGTLARLTVIAEVHFRKERKLDALAKLENEGFWFPGGRFALNDNYGFGEQALCFFFNAYEIAPYFMGPTLVQIPYAEIRDLIRPGSHLSPG
jgi:uncharacterized protein